MAENKYQVKVNQELCAGCGTCIAMSPEVFEFNDDFKAQVKDNAVIDDAKVLETAQSCPSQAIIIENREDEVQAYPEL